MAYQMEYAFEHLKRTRVIQKRHNSILAGLLLVALAILIRLSGVAADVALFSNREQLQVSAMQMVEQLRDGKDLNDAVYTFCEDMSYAKSSD